MRTIVATINPGDASSVAIRLQIAPLALRDRRINKAATASNEYEARSR